MYYNWLYHIYFKPLISRNLKGKYIQKVEIFDFIELEQAIENSFQGMSAFIIQFIVFSAGASLISYFSLLAY
jgi:hypothetical protein